MNVWHTENGLTVQGNIQETPRYSRMSVKSLIELLHGGLGPQKTIWNELRKRKVTDAQLRDLCSFAHTAFVRKASCEMLLERPYRDQNIVYLFEFHPSMISKAWKRVLGRYEGKGIPPDLLRRILPSCRGRIAGEISDFLIHDWADTESLLQVLAWGPFPHARRAWKMLRGRKGENRKLMIALRYCSFPSLREEIWERIRSQNPTFRDLIDIVNFVPRYRMCAGKEMLRKNPSLKRARWIKRRIPSLAPHADRLLRKKAAAA